MILHSRIEGNGKPLVIIHGFLGMSDNWKSLATQFAAQGFQTHTLDLRNHGKSLPTKHEVKIIESPNVPGLAITAVQCIPYSVSVSVTNVQPGVVYYWSNGAIGASTIVTHDGPLQVRAEAFGCISRAQIFLPLDLKQHEWLFPKGCFDYCKILEFNGYIIGPLGDVKWFWWQDGAVVSSGTETVEPHVVTEGEHALELSNNYCNETFSTATFKVEECNICEVELIVNSLTCEKIGGITVYVLDMTIHNYMGPMSATLTAPYGEGYFSPSTVILPNGGVNYTGYFIPNNNFSGGGILISIAGADGVEINCQTLVEFDLNCEENPIVPQPLSTVIVAPNPTADFATVLYELLQEGCVQLIVTDANGKELYKMENQLHSGNFKIDLSRYPVGYYPLQLLQNGEIIYNTQIIKK
jgi:hypothetical protein